MCHSEQVQEKYYVAAQAERMAAHSSSLIDSIWAKVTELGLFILRYHRFLFTITYVDEGDAAQLVKHMRTEDGLLKWRKIRI